MKAKDYQKALKSMGRVEAGLGFTRRWEQLPSVVYANNYVRRQKERATGPTDAHFVAASGEDRYFRHSAHKQTAIPHDDALSDFWPKITYYFEKSRIFMDTVRLPYTLLFLSSTRNVKNTIDTSAMTSSIRSRRPRTKQERRSPREPRSTAS
ncbi:MAG: hypothetical protein Q9159_003052 [Coniocarpon cinnabarinum]